MRVAKMALTLAGFFVLMLFAGTFMAAAHETNDQAADTPFGSPQGLANGLPHSAVANGRGAADNSLFRNPTCGAHYGPDGIHPPGNPSE